MTDPRTALEALALKYASHRGSCCAFDADGQVIVTRESCKCGGVERAAQEAMGLFGRPDEYRRAALATPPAPEERCEGCAGNFVDGHCARHAPAPEPSAALVGVCIEPRAGGGICGHTEKWYGHGEPMPPEYMGSHLFRPLAATRAEGLDGLVSWLRHNAFCDAAAGADPASDRCTCGLSAAYQTALAACRTPEVEG